MHTMEHLRRTNYEEHDVNATKNNLIQSTCIQRRTMTLRTPVATTWVLQNLTAAHY